MRTKLIIISLLLTILLISCDGNIRQEVKKNSTGHYTITTTWEVNNEKFSTVENYVEKNNVGTVKKRQYDFAKEHIKSRKSRIVAPKRKN